MEVFTFLILINLDFIILFRTFLMLHFPQALHFCKRRPAAVVYCKDSGQWSLIHSNHIFELKLEKKCYLLRILVVYEELLALAFCCAMSSAVNHDYMGSFGCCQFITPFLYCNKRLIELLCFSCLFVSNDILFLDTVASRPLFNMDNICRCCIQIIKFLASIYQSKLVIFWIPYQPEQYD